MTELERLQKEINGALVKHTDGTDQPWVNVDAICIWEPGGDVVSIKPYGYDPEELYEIGNGKIPLFALKSPEFCFSSISTSAELWGNIDINVMLVLKTLNDVVSSGEFNVSTFAAAIGFDVDRLGVAYCPYG
jgi:hypothetical protein